MHGEPSRHAQPPIPTNAAMSFLLLMSFAFSIQLRSGCSKRVGGTRTADPTIVPSLEPTACFVPYLLNNAGRGSCGGFPDAWRASFLSRSFPARRRSLGSKSLLTGARLKFPILEQGFNIQPAFSVQVASLKRVLDSGLSGLMDALSCPFTLAPMKPATIPQLT
jgi:hypothetical protein